MKLNLTKIKLVLLTLALIVASFPFPAEAANPSPSTPGYYSYKSKKAVLDEFNKNFTVPAWKKTMLLSQLSADGYFELKTKQAKMNYINRRLATDASFILVTRAERTNGWNVNPSGIPEVTSLVSNDLKALLLAEANDSYKEWAGFLLFMADKQQSSCKEKYPSQIVSFCFYQKKYWIRGNLDRLYDYYWSDLKAKNRNKPEFTAQEKRRIDKLMVAGLGDVANKMPQVKNAGDVGFSGDSPWDDVLVFVPVDRILAPVGKYGLRIVGKVGTKIVSKGGSLGSSILGHNLAARFVEVQTKYLGKVSIINIAGSSLFQNSTLSSKEREAAFASIVKTIDHIKGHPRFGKYFTGEFAQQVIYNTHVLSAPKVGEQFGKKWWQRPPAGFASGSQGAFKRLVMSEDDLMENRFAKANATLVHEFFHTASKQIDGFGIKYYSKSTGGYPLEEGVTEALSKIFMRDIGQPVAFSTAYRGETKVAEELLRTYQRKFGEEMGMQYFCDSYFKYGLDSMNASLEAGLHDTLHGFMLKGDWNGAIKHLKGIKF